MSGIQNLADENIIMLYENIRQQVYADAGSDTRYRFVGEATQRYAERLREEMEPSPALHAN